MSSQGVDQVTFDFLPQLPVIVQPSAGQLSSDAGLLPLRQFDQRWNFTARMSRCLHDPKPQRQHILQSMLRQRIFGILAGYEDCNDHDTLRDDPVFKLIADRLPKDDPLASQPTLSRFENLATPAVLQRLIDFNIATGIELLKQVHGGKLPASITLDLDATDDPTHGHQQLTLFHGPNDPAAAKLESHRPARFICAIVPARIRYLDSPLAGIQVAVIARGGGGGCGILQSRRKKSPGCNRIERGEEGDRFGLNGRLLCPCHRPCEKMHGSEQQRCANSLEHSALCALGWPSVRLPNQLLCTIASRS